jgi:hypothetical protein
LKHLATLEFKTLSKNGTKLGMVVCTYNSSTGKAEVGGSRVQDQPGLCSETQSQKKKDMSQKKIPVKYVVNIEPVSRMNKTHNAL